jgi:hypothetical protein
MVYLITVFLIYHDNIEEGLLRKGVILDISLLAVIPHWGFKTPAPKYSSSHTSGSPRLFLAFCSSKYVGKAFHREWVWPGLVISQLLNTLANGHREQKCNYMVDPLLCWKLHFLFPVQAQGAHAGSVVRKFATSCCRMVSYNPLHTSHLSENFMGSKLLSIGNQILKRSCGPFVHPQGII